MKAKCAKSELRGEGSLRMCYFRLHFRLRERDSYLVGGGRWQRDDANKTLAIVCKMHGN